MSRKRRRGTKDLATSGSGPEAERCFTNTNTTTTMSLRLRLALNLLLFWNNSVYCPRQCRAVIHRLDVCHQSRLLTRAPGNIIIFYASTSPFAFLAEPSNLPR
ncbi:uncharacterized protein ARMOST_07469 [Armillaria ostoyae]|uniref:Uncharacterized protein n=1 Tax=Armillaria ostoyae TaxID=47428 RepID=A0A284R5W6_ARMOS|nr:uncharacterized protein ARMOST_07469 [Armillaria ostoyae]